MLRSISSLALLLLAVLAAVIDTAPSPSSASFQLPSTTLSLLVTSPADIQSWLRAVADVAAAAQPQLFKRCSYTVRRLEANTYQFEDIALKAIGMGLHELAVEILINSLAIDDQAEETWYRLGNAFHELRLDYHAAACYRRCLALNQNDLRFWNDLGSAYIALRLWPESVAAFHKALLLAPNSSRSVPLQNVIQVQRKTCEWQDYHWHIKLLEEAWDEAHSRNTNVEPPWMSSRWRFHPLKILRNTQTWALAAAKAVAGVRPFPAVPLLLHGNGVAQQLLKVGYVSATGFQGNTTTARFMQRIFSLHDASRIEVICVARAGDDGTSERSFIREGCREWLQFEKHDLYGAAAAINAIGVHVLIDLSGWTIFPGVEVFAMKPAPLQLQLHGYPGSMGADYYHYLATDAITSPPDYVDQYVEKLLLLPGTYLVSDFKQSRPEMLPQHMHKSMLNATTGMQVSWPSRLEHNFTQDDLILGAFNSLYKLDPRTWDIWMQIMQRLPQTNIWMLFFDDVAPHTLRRLAEEAGVHPSRLRFSPFFEKMLELPTKNFDALWAGLPFVTIAGHDFAARVAAGLAYAVGMPHMIARSESEYVELAVQLLQKSRHTKWKAELQEKKLTHLAFDTVSWVRHWEALLAMMFDTLSAGLPPQHMLAAHVHGTL